MNACSSGPLDSNMMIGKLFFDGSALAFRTVKRIMDDGWAFCPRALFCSHSLLNSIYLTMLSRVMLSCVVWICMTV